MLIGELYVPFPEARARTLLADGNQFQKFLRGAGFYLNHQKFSCSSAELISGYLNCLLEFGELGFPLDLTLLI